jgi:SAM-dependent methyltransferase
MSNRDAHNCYFKDGPFVEFFDQHFCDLSQTVYRGDIEFYRALAAETKGDVLELGSGTGRVAIPISLRNKDVTGLEISPFMLKRAVENATRLKSSARFRLGDMANFDLKKKFGFIYVAFGGFHHLETVEDQLQCLRCVNNHLSDSGLLVIHIKNPAVHLLVDIDCEPNKRRKLLAIDEASGSRVVSESIRQKVNPHMQWVTETWEHTRYDNDGRVTSVESSEFRLRWIYRFEMEHLLVRSGFKPIECLSDFVGNRVKDEVQHIWIVKRHS